LLCLFIPPHIKNTHTPIKNTAAFARTRDPTQVIGGDLVSEDDALRYCREIVTFLRTLKVCVLV
jgi:hypothetical protein